MSQYNFIIEYDATKTMAENVKRSDAILDKLVPALHKKAKDDARKLERSLGLKDSTTSKQRQRASKI
jgi:hypothetical protein